MLTVHVIIQSEPEKEVENQISMEMFYNMSDSQLRFSHNVSNFMSKCFAVCPFSCVHHNRAGLGNVSMYAVISLCQVVVSG